MKEVDRPVLKVGQTSISPDNVCLYNSKIPVETSGRLRPLLCCDASVDGSLVAAGTDLQKEDAFVMYWSAMY